MFVLWSWFGFVVVCLVLSELRLRGGVVCGFIVFGCGVCVVVLLLCFVAFG